jgi:hypothetical protein
MSYREEVHSWEVLHKEGPFDDGYPNLHEALIVRDDFGAGVFIVLRPRPTAYDWINLDPEMAEDLGNRLIKLAAMARQME